MPGHPAALVPCMRRVNWVRITVADGRTRCEAIGTGHRLPVVREISLGTAMSLVAQGVPSVIRSHDGRRVPVPTS